MNRRTFIRGSLGTSVLLLIGETDAQRSPYVVGTTVSRSGAYASFSGPIEKALVLWAEELDDALGFGGRGVELLVEDDASDPETARGMFQALARESDALIAPYGSELTGAVMPVVERAGLPCIAPSAGSAELWEEPRSWTAQLLNPVDTTFASTLGLAAAEGVRSVALLHRPDPFSEIVMDGAAAYADRFGIELTRRERFSTEEEVMSLMGEIRAGLLLAMGFRQGGAGFGFVEDALMLHAAFRTVRPDVEWLSLGIGAAGADFGSRAHVSPDGVFATTGWRSYLPTPGNASFVARYAQRWGHEADTHSAQAYAAGELLVRAYERQRDASPDAIRDALFMLDVETVFGRYKVDGRGQQVGKENAVIRWSGREPRVLYPPRYRT